MKYISYIYCFLCTIFYNKKFKFNVLFNNPNKINKTLYNINILVDAKFTTQERAYILEAAKKIEEFSNKIIIFNINFDLSNKSTTNSYLIIKSNKTDPEIKYVDHLHNCNILGYYQMLPYDVRIIYLVPERFIDKTHYVSVVIHELGHLIGLDHTPRPSLMHINNYNNLIHFTINDAKEFAARYKCDINSLYYLKYI